MSVKFENNFNFTKEEIEKATQSTLKEIGVHISAESKSIAPVQDGFLRRSITFKTYIEHKKVSIGSGLKYAKFVHDGTGIYSKNGGRKTPWTYMDGGKYYTTKGQKSQEYMKIAVKNQNSAIANIAKRYFSKVGGQ